jgi:hypothetical protein
LENRSQLHLRSVGVIRKKNGKLHGSWIGELAPGQSISFANPDTLPQLATETAPFDAERKTEGQIMAATERLNLEPLFRLAYASEHLDEGELRLVGRIDETIPGQTVTPSASQLRSGTLVVAHLAYGQLPPPRPDKNTKLDMKIRQDEE